jgi:ketosteroid isomerase-like protein
MSQQRRVGHPKSPAAPIRALYRAINERDYEAGFALLREDFEWLEPEHGLLGGPHRGVDEVQRAIEMQLEVFDEFTIEPEEFHEHGDYVAVPVRQRARWSQRRRGRDPDRAPLDRQERQGDPPRGIPRARGRPRSGQRSSLAALVLVGQGLTARSETLFTPYLTLASRARSEMNS